MPDYELMGDFTWGDIFSMYDEPSETFEEGSPEMFEYLEANPYMQWGLDPEDWDAETGTWAEGVTPGMLESGEFATPYYWGYEDIGDDDPYMSLEDLIYEVTEGEAGYSEIFGGDAPGEVGLEYGTGVDSIYGLYMDEFFEFNPETGSFESRYDPLEFEKQERFKLKQGQEKLVSDIEGLSGKYRQEYGRGLGVDTLDIGDIASIIDPQSETLQGEYGFGVEESELAYLDDMLGEFAQMTSDATWLDPDL